MMRRLVPLAFLLALPATGQTPAANPGKKLFERTCAPCHGQGPGDDGAKLLPGTAALEARYGGATPAALERRRDLTPEVIHYFVRNGSGAMPMFRKTEITDAEIAAIAAYLKKAAGAPAQ